MNVNTIADALQGGGNPPDSQVTLTNPGGNNPWLFTWPATAQANAGVPVVLEVPSVQANGVLLGTLAGAANSDRLWCADGNAFVVRAVGKVQPVATGKTLKLYLFAGSGEPQSGLPDFQIGPVQSFALGTPTGGAFSNFWLEARCVWDAASLQLTGTIKSQCAGVLSAEAAFSVYNPSGWLAQQAAGAYNNLPFVLGANLASTANNPSNDLVILTEYSAEAL